VAALSKHKHETTHLNKIISLIASVLIISAMTIGISAHAVSQEAVVSRGHQFALVVCAACHIVATDQKTPPILRSPGPSFDTIANRPGTTADSLKNFLATTHAEIAGAAGMPNEQLADYQTDEVISYILSLRRSR
jgi:mono/diheme cytochrome c family protein